MPDSEQFVSEPITPARGSGDASAMAKGEPGLPAQFTWRDCEYRVVAVLRQWKTSGPCHHGSGEVYLRRHWYQVQTDPPATMTLYCQRQPMRGGNPKSRWWVYSVTL